MHASTKGETPPSLNGCSTRGSSGVISREQGDRLRCPHRDRTQHPGSAAEEIELLLYYGASPETALAEATHYAAGILLLGGRIGSMRRRETPDLVFSLKPVFKIQP